MVQAARAEAAAELLLEVYAKVEQVAAVAPVQHIFSDARTFHLLSLSLLGLVDLPEVVGDLPALAQMVKLVLIRHLAPIL